MPVNNPIELRHTLRVNATAAINRSDWKDALACYEALERIDRREGDWPRKAGEMRRRLGQPREAAAAFARAIEIYARGGNLLKAIAVCKLSLVIYPKDTEMQKRLQSLWNSQRAGLAPAAPAPPPAPDPRPRPVELTLDDTLTDWREVQV
jgi:tetratricopeptide (TPR) repeat protein